MAHILLIGAQHYYEKNLALSLGIEGYTVSMRSTAVEALAVLLHGQPDVVLLCIAPTGIDPFALCRAIRILSTVPIICLDTAHEEASLVRLLEAGADVYLQRPIGLLELNARVKAGLRRPGFRAPAPIDEPEQSLILGEDYGAARSNH